ncbi:HD-GYP domain-containing protein [Bacillus horti]|uniref:Nucleotidyltransferase with HDIG domain n=1 Tax=Caldalkalibacillus horti TaxID=77523 RepID=A0ABT9VVX5_9BACI|nr:HD domain-containing phosphohydrolase [Bacillus horti]MDQ0165019.1 putative nucleotidyltransferase with HDIG domain [Bacillus horti]
MFYKTLKELQAGDIINEDLYHNDSLLIKKGTELQPQYITKLKRFCIDKIAILAPLQKISEQKIHTSFEQIIKQVEQSHPDKKTSLTFFYQTAQHLLSENRYGLALNSEEQLSMVIEQFEALMQNSFIHGLFLQLKDWDEYTYKHVVDVFVLGILFANYLGLPKLSFMAKACLLHDVGKLSVPLSIIQKNGALTYEEFELMKQHSIKGETMLDTEEETNGISYIVRQHHERLDGTGYPDGLKEDQIDNYTRILMIVDVYSALTLDRSYQAAKGSQEALSIMSLGQSKFDTVYLRKFMDMLHIYAKHSIVTLSSGEKAQVLEANDYYPYLPKLRNLTTKEIERLPINLSTHISKSTMLPQEALEQGVLHGSNFTYEQFVQELLAGDYFQASHVFRDLTHQLQLDQVYTDLIYKTLQALIHKLNEEEISLSDLYLAFQDINQLAFHNLDKIRGSIDTKRKILIVTPGIQDMPFISQFIQHCFRLKGWDAIVMEHQLAIVDIAKFMKRHHIHYVCTFLTPMSDVEEVELFMQVFKRYYPQYVVTLCTEFYQNNFTMKNHSDFHGTLEELMEKLAVFYSMTNNGDFLHFVPYTTSNSNVHTPSMLTLE